MPAHDKEGHSAMSELLDRSKFFRDHVGGVLNLATGALVLSITFLHNEEGHLRQTYLLKRSWTFLFATIFLAVAYNYILNQYVRNEGKRYTWPLRGLSLLFHAAFVFAIFYLFRFGLWNV